MNFARLIHQQIMQLKWHFLACLGLIMVLPLEEAIVNLNDGAGFYSAHMFEASLFIFPLLAGIIACANVQADLDDKRYIFWRSKPVGIKSFIALKFLVGLAISGIILACPFLFAKISHRICDPYENISTVMPLMYNCVLIAVMAYSLCFFCNVLVRKTARAWLIGMAMTCFLLLVPFILPLSFKDIRSDFLMVASMIYISITLGASLVAFVIALFAVNRNWHLQTNLQGLLWTGAGLVFLLMVLFGRQVANIKILDTKIENHYAALNRIGETYIFAGKYASSGNAVSIRGSQIDFHRVDSAYLFPPWVCLRMNKLGQEEMPEKLHLETYPEETFLYHETGGQLYAFSLYKYYELKKEEYKEGRYHDRQIDKECYLKCFKIIDGQYVQVDSFDLSNCLQEDNNGYLTMRLVEDKIIVFVTDQCVIVSISDPGDLKMTGKGKVKRYRSHYMLSKEQKFKIPLIPSEGIEIYERIRVSIDFNFWGGYRRGYFFARRSLVDIYGDKISFCHIDKDEISRFDVIEWDDEYVYCRYRDSRPFTFLEQRISPLRDGWRFVQDGKLYAFNDAKLMILDIRSKRIRKLGHWERWTDDYWIEELEVLDGGDMLLSARERVRINDGKEWEWKSFLHLLKNPE